MSARARRGAVAFVVAVALAVAAVLVAVAHPLRWERAESLDLALEHLGDPGSTQFSRVVRVPDEAVVTDVTVTTTGPDDAAWTVELCEHGGDACRPLDVTLVGSRLTAGAYDVRAVVQVPEETAGPSAGLTGRLGFAAATDPAGQSLAIGALALAAFVAGVVGAVLVAPRRPDRAQVPPPRPDRELEEARP